MTAATYIDLRTDINKPDLQQLNEFFTEVFKQGQAAATALDYVSIPENIAQNIEKYLG